VADFPGSPRIAAEAKKGDDPMTVEIPISDQQHPSRVEWPDQGILRRMVRLGPFRYVIRFDSDKQEDTAMFALIRDHPAVLLGRCRGDLTAIDPSCRDDAVVAEVENLREAARARIEAEGLLSSARADLAELESQLEDPNFADRFDQVHARVAQARQAVEREAGRVKIWANAENSQRRLVAEARTAAHDAAQDRIRAKVDELVEEVEGLLDHAYSLWHARAPELLERLDANPTGQLNFASPLLDQLGGTRLKSLRWRPAIVRNRQGGYDFALKAVAQSVPQRGREQPAAAPVAGAIPPVPPSGAYWAGVAARPQAYDRDTWLFWDLLQQYMPRTAEALKAADSVTQERNCLEDIRASAALVAIPEQWRDFVRSFAKNNQPEEMTPGKLALMRRR
jgi:hypothetical protein